MKFYGHEIVIMGENDDCIFFTFDNNKILVSKALHSAWGVGSTRWFSVGNIMYEDIGFDAKDGYAVSNGVYETYEYSSKVGFCLGDKINHNKNISDKVEIKFPLIHEILSDEKLFGESLYYAMDIGEDLEDIFHDGAKLDIGMFFEGFFFGGCSSPSYNVLVNGKTA